MSHKALHIYTKGELYGCSNWNGEMMNVSKGLLDFIPSGEIENYYSISYRCGYRDFNKIFSLYVEDQEENGDLRNSLSLSSFKRFCIDYKESQNPAYSMPIVSTEVSHLCERHFKDIDMLIYNSLTIDKEIKQNAYSGRGKWNTRLPSVKIKLDKIDEIKKNIKDLAYEVNEIIKISGYKPMGVESLYFVKRFDLLQEAVRYVKIKVVDGFMIEGAEKMFEDIAHKGAAETKTPFMAYYIHYKFSLLFDDDIRLL